MDLDSIALYLGLECHAPQAARKTVRTIEEAIERVASFPESDKHLDWEGLAGSYCMTRAEPYLIFYRHNETTLTVYRVLHQRQDIDTYAIMSLKD